MDAEGLKLSQYVVVSDRIYDENVGRSIRVVYGTRSGTLLSMDDSEWKAVSDGRLSSLGVDSLTKLIEHQVIVPQEIDELADILSENRHASTSSDELYHVIQPTAWCQLGCGYCGQSHVAKTLEPKNRALVLEQLDSKLKTGRYKSLRVCWFGGEPLTGLSVIRELSPKLGTLAKQHSCSYYATLVSNGLTLTRDLATELVNKAQVNRIEVTLDGPAEYHDSRRFKKSGSGTFKRIFANLKDIASVPDLGCKLSVRCNVDASNVDGVPLLIAELAAAGLSSRVTFYTSPVYSWGNDAHHLSLSLERYADEEIRWKLQLLSLGFDTELRPRRRPIVCIAVRNDGEVVDAFGRVYGCTEIPYVPAYQASGKHDLGSVGQERSSHKESEFRAFYDEVAAGKYSCSKCAMLPVCGGGCPKQWQEGRMPCPSAKINMPDRLAIELLLDRNRTSTQLAREAGLEVYE